MAVKKYKLTTLTNLSGGSNNIFKGKVSYPGDIIPKHLFKYFSEVKEVETVISGIAEDTDKAEEIVEDTVEESAGFDIEEEPVAKGNKRQKPKV